MQRTVVRTRARVWGRRLLIALAVLAVVAMAGPRTRASEPPLETVRSQLPASLAEVSEWINQRERAAGALDTFTAARVHFHGDTTRTAWSVVHLHGFSGSRQESAPFAESIARQLGANLFEVRLAGHGMSPDSLRSPDAEAWMADAVIALGVGELLGDSVVLIGTSTGGTLASWLTAHAAHESAPIGAVILMSPNFGVKGPLGALLRYPWSNVILPRLMPRIVLSDQPPENDEVARMGLPWVPFAAAFPMQALVDHVSAMSLATYRAPTLLLQNRDDPVVDATRAEEWLARLRDRGVAVSEEWIVPAEGEHPHVLAGRWLSPSRVEPLTARVVRFVGGQQ